MGFYLYLVGAHLAPPLLQINLKTQGVRQLLVRKCIHFLQQIPRNNMSKYKTDLIVTLVPGARVRPPTNYWVSYQPTIGYLTNQLLGILPTSYWVCYQPIYNIPFIMEIQLTSVFLFTSHVCCRISAVSI